MKEILRDLYKKLHIIHNIYIKNNFLIKKNTYSMEGEDLEINKVLNKITEGFYVDVGGYHPIHRNNTYLLYEKNWRGINIDINKFSVDLFNFLRPDDINLNMAVSNTNKDVKYYFQKELSQLNTIKKDVASRRMQGHVKEKIIKSQTLTSILNDTIYKNKKIDFLNIDVEGADFEVLQSLDFNLYRPKVICVEIDEKEYEKSEIYNFLKILKYTKKWSGTLSYLFVDDLYNFS